MPAKNPTTFVNSITCFNEKDQFDPEAQRQLFRRFVAAGIGVYVGGGEAGEALTLTPPELKQLMQLAKEELKGKVPVRVGGFETRRSQDMLDLYEATREFAFEAIQLYGSEGHGSGGGAGPVIDGYFREILPHIKSPCVIASSETAGFVVPLPVLKKLVADFPQIIGVTASTIDLTYVDQIRQQLGPNFQLHLGTPLNTPAALVLGANGYVSNEGNVAPKTCMAVVKSYAAGNEADFAHAYSTVCSLFRNGAGGKAGLLALGVPGTFPRRPWVHHSEAELAPLRKKLDQLQVRKLEGLA